MTTGVRRGELCGLRFSRIDFGEGVIDLRKNWVNGKEKDTKTHQNRRIALDTENVVLLKEQRDRVKSAWRRWVVSFRTTCLCSAARRRPTTQRRTRRTL